MAQDFEKPAKRLTVFSSETVKHLKNCQLNNKH